MTKVKRPSRQPVNQSTRRPVSESTATSEAEQQMNWLYENHLGFVSFECSHDASWPGPAWPGHRHNKYKSFRMLQITVRLIWLNNVCDRSKRINRIGCHHNSHFNLQYNARAMWCCQSPSGVLLIQIENDWKWFRAKGFSKKHHEPESEPMMVHGRCWVSETTTSLNWMARNSIMTYQRGSYLIRWCDQFGVTCEASIVSEWCRNDSN